MARYRSGLVVLNMSFVARDPTTQSGKGNEERGTGLAPQYPSCFSSALSCRSSPGPVCDGLWGDEGT